MRSNINGKWFFILKLIIKNDMLTAAVIHNLLSLL